jgi:hypothetical protein
MKSFTLADLEEEKKQESAQMFSRKGENPRSLVLPERTENGCCERNRVAPHLYFEFACA